MPPNGELYIRYSASDHGGRDIPAGTEYRLSPAIEIIGSGLGAGVIRAGLDQLVRVHVGNQGANAHTDVTVQVFATNWGTANPWLESLGGSGGRDGGPFTVVGNARWDNNSEGIIDIGWHPDPAELGGMPHLHVCLFANVYRPGDGAAQSVPPNFAPPDIETDQHHAQRNMTLVAAALGNKIGMVLHAANIGKKREAFLLEVTETPGARLDLGDLRQLVSADWFTKAEKRLGKRPPLAKRARAVGLEVEGHKPAARLKLELDAGQQVPVRLLATPANPKEPALHRFTIVQRSARTREIVGGARLLAAVLPRKLIPEPLLTDHERHGG